MPRGFKISPIETAERHKWLIYRDPRSFCSLDGHDLLYGEDKDMRRREIFKASDGRVSWQEGEWHHLRNAHNRNRRCDCVEGAAWIRPEEHRKEHVQVMWTKKGAEEKCTS